MGYQLRIAIIKEQVKLFAAQAKDNLNATLTGVHQEIKLSYQRKRHREVTAGIVKQHKTRIALP